MKTDTKAIGIAYYTALGNKDLETVKRYLHPEIQFADPQEKIMGRDAVLGAAKGFSGVFTSLSIRTSFGGEDKAAIVYEVEIPGLPKKLQAVSLLSFQEGLIVNIELFYDTKALGK